MTIIPQGLALGKCANCLFNSSAYPITTPGEKWQAAFLQNSVPVGHNKKDVPVGHYYLCWWILAHSMAGGPFTVFVCCCPEIKYFTRLSFKGMVSRWDTFFTIGDFRMRYSRQMFRCVCVLLFGEQILHISFPQRNGVPMGHHSLFVH